MRIRLFHKLFLLIAGTSLLAATAMAVKAQQWVQTAVASALYPLPATDEEREVEEREMRGELIKSLEVRR